MSDKDFAAGVVTMVPNGAAISKKPAHLVMLEPVSKPKRFISFDKPELHSDFIQVKGFFADCSEDDVIKNYSELLTNARKEDIVEMLFPVNRVISIRNLVFKAK